MVAVNVIARGAGVAAKKSKIIGNAAAQAAARVGVTRRKLA
jgi:hypothetical protein